MNPAVAGDLVIAGSCSGTLFAFDRANGEPRWAFNSELDGYRANFHGKPIVEDGTVIIGTDSADTGYIYAFDLETGETRWKREFREGVAADLLRFGDAVIAVTLSDQVHALDFETGKTLWSHGDGGDQGPEDYRTERFRWTASPATDGRHIFWASLSGRLTALDPNNGATVWKTELGAPVTAYPIRDGKSILVGTEDGKLHRVNAGTGKHQASFDLGDTPRYQITALGSGYLVLLETAVAFAAVDRRLTKVLWKAEAPEAWSSFQPTMWRGSILLGDSLGELVALDPATGNVRWRTTLEGELRGLSCDDTTIFAGNLQGRLFALTPPQ